VNAEFSALLRRYLKYAGDQEIADDTPLRDLGLDSMRAIELLFAVEDTYGVAIPDERLTDATFETGRALWTVIEELREPVVDGERR
jgi:acyl carrier protein